MSCFNFMAASVSAVILEPLYSLDTNPLLGIYLSIYLSMYIWSKLSLSLVFNFLSNVLEKQKF